MARNINYSNDLFNPDLYYICADGTIIELVPNNELGLTEEVITVIRQMNKEEHKSDLINNRYLKDSRYEEFKKKHPEYDEIHIMDKFQTFLRLESEKEADTGFYTRIRSILPLLTEDQRRLYRMCQEGLSYKQIADTEGTTKNAIASRMRKLQARLYRLYEMKFGNN